MISKNYVKRKFKNYMNSRFDSSNGVIISFNDSHFAALFDLDHPGKSPVGCIHIYKRSKTIAVVIEAAFTTEVKINVAKAQSLVQGYRRVKVLEGDTPNRIQVKKTIIVKDPSDLEQRLDDTLLEVIQASNEIIDSKSVTIPEQQYELKANGSIFEAFLSDDPEIRIYRALINSNYTDKVLSFLDAYFAAVIALVDGKAAPYSFEIGSAYDYLDAVIRYTCEYIVDIDKMYRDIKEYAAWFLKNEKMLFLRHPPHDRIALIANLMKNEFQLAVSFAIEGGSMGNHKEIVQYISDSSRTYILEKKIRNLESYVCTVGIEVIDCSSNTLGI